MSQVSQGRNRRGEPLMMLVLVLIGWIGARAMVIAESGPSRSVELDRAGDVRSPRGKLGRPATLPRIASTALFARAGNAPPADRVDGPSSAAQATLPAPIGQSARSLIARTAMGGKTGLPSGAAEDFPDAAGQCCESDRLPAATPLLLADQSRSAPPQLARPVSASVARWSGDGWILLRGGGSAAALAAAGAAAYGGSQAGAVLRYRLDPDSRFRPAAYVRGTSALGGAGIDRQAALGLAARPVPGLPVALLAEGRAQQSPQTTRLRPALALVSELPPQRLPLGAEAEFYGQAGWVGGRDATAFFDAQLTADRPVAHGPAGMEVRVGAGAWSGGQRGAARLDIGPRLALRATLGKMPARLALDWRFRAAGHALPGSGPTLTLATGF